MVKSDVRVRSQFLIPKKSQYKNLECLFFSKLQLFIFPSLFVSISRMQGLVIPRKFIK